MDARGCGTFVLSLHRGFGPFLLGLVLLACLLCGPAPRAQESASPVNFDIPAQPLASALNSWAVQANTQVFFEQGPVAGLTAPPISGSLPPREALHALLAHSGLEFVQNADGAFVVRPAVVKTARHTIPARPVAATEPAASTQTLPVMLAPRSARDAEGPWELRLRGSYLDPRHVSDALLLPTTPGSGVPRDDTRTDHSGSPELDLEYFFNSYWSTELALSLPEIHDLTLRDSTYADGTVGRFRLMPDFLTIKYNILPNGAFRPYIGAGINVTSFYSVNAGPFGLTRTTTGPAAQLGFDVPLSEHWMLNADAKWARARPAIAFEGGDVGRMNVDPVLLSVGIGYRFGGSPAPVPPPAEPPAPVVVPPPPPPDSDGDGVPDSIDQCPNTPHGVQVDAVGCPLDSDHDGVPDYLDKCPGTPPGLKVDAEGCEIEEMILRGVNFKTNSADLEPASAEVLDGVVAVLVQRPDSKAEIRGYTDSRGADAYNLKLSERRAAAVVAYLVAHGIPGDNLRSIGFGKDNPIASNDTAEGRAQNRRVTVQFSRSVRR